MRVIAGSARRINLVTPSGPHTRPTTDRIKETLFNIIQGDIPDSRFLDLFAGSGGVGIEAVSRGAKEAVFVDTDAQALRCIRENLHRTRFDSCCEVYGTDAKRALTKLSAAGRRFDIIFVDPPYASDYEDILNAVKNAGVLAPDGYIIVETDIRRSLDLSGTGLRIDRVKEYKTNKHIFISGNEVP